MVYQLGFGPAGGAKNTEEQMQMDGVLNISDDDIVVRGETRLQVWTPYDPSSTRPPSFNEIKSWIQELRTQRLDSELHLPPTLKKGPRANVHEYCRKLGMQSVSYGSRSQRYMVIRPKGANVSADRMLTAAAEKAIQFSFEEQGKMSTILEQHPATKDDLVHIQQLEKSQQMGSDKRLVDLACLPSLGASTVPSCKVPPRMQSAKEQLPITKYRQHIIDTMRTNDVVIISGGTGTGKSTQVPQYVLEAACESREKVRVVCTQPRRLPAITVAERVAAERGEPVGETVGYHIRLKRKLTRNSVLVFCTPGVLLRTIKSKRLSDVTHVFLVGHVNFDEVHERDMETDYLLAVLKDIQTAQRRAGMRPLKIILMSATMEANLELFQRFFPSAVHLEVEGRMFDVEMYHLEDVLSMVRYEPEMLVEVGTFDASELHLAAAGDNDWSKPDSIGFGATSAAAAEPAVKSRDVELLSDCEENMLEPDFETDYDADLRQLPERFNPEVLTQFMPIGRNKQAKKLLRSYRASRDAVHLVDKTDLDLAVEVAVYINNSHVPGAVLVFLTGYEDINTMNKLLLRDEVTSRCSQKWHIFMLHSEIDARCQQQVFEHSKSGRKIILSTNIAEASLTIDDVVFVIDCGRVKEKRYYPKTHISTLLPVSIAKSNAEQRKGRAGRCQRGYCFRLFTLEDYDLMPLAATPEIKRIAIHEICLHARQMADEQQTIAEFLAKCPEPPAPDAIAESVEYLKLLSALTSDEQLTSIGRVMTELPLDPRFTRMLLWAITLRCIEPVLTITALMSYRDPFTIPTGDRRKELDSIRGSLARTDLSDHIMYLRAFYDVQGFIHIRNRLRHYCDKKFISMQNLEMCSHIRLQLLNELCRLKLVNSESWSQMNTFSSSWPMVKACLVGGSYPAIGFVGDPKRFQKIKTVREHNCELAPGCALRFESQRIRRGTEFKYIRSKNDPPPDDDEWVPPPSDVRWVMYSELVQFSHRVVLKNVTAVSPMMVCLLGGTSCVPSAFGREADGADESGENLFALADWLQCNMSTPNLVSVHQLRVHLHAMFIRCITRRGTLSNIDQNFIGTLHELLRISERSSGFAPVNNLPKHHEWPKTLPAATNTDMYGHGAHDSDSRNGPPPQRQHNSTNNNYAQTHNNRPTRGGFQHHNSYGQPPVLQWSRSHPVTTAVSVKPPTLESEPKPWVPSAAAASSSNKPSKTAMNDDAYSVLSSDSAIHAAGPIVNQMPTAQASGSGFSASSSSSHIKIKPFVMMKQPVGRGQSKRDGPHAQDAGNSLDLKDLGINIGSNATGAQQGNNSPQLPLRGFGRGFTTPTSNSSLTSGRGRGSTLLNKMH